MRLRYPNDYPENNTIHLAYNYRGFVGILLFDGGWQWLKSRGEEVMSTCSSLVWLSDKDDI